MANSSQLRQLLKPTTLFQAQYKSVTALSAAQQKLSPKEDKTIKIWIIRFYGLGYPTTKKMISGMANMFLQKKARQKNMLPETRKKLG